MVSCCSTRLAWKATLGFLAEDHIAADAQEEVCTMTDNQLDFIRSAAKFIKTVLLVVVQNSNWIRLVVVAMGRPHAIVGGTPKRRRDATAG